MVIDIEFLKLIGEQNKFDSRFGSDKMEI